MLSSGIQWHGVFMILRCLCILPFHRATAIKYHNTKTPASKSTSGMHIVRRPRYPNIGVPHWERWFHFTMTMRCLSARSPPGAEEGGKPEINTQRQFRHINRNRFMQTQRTEMLIEILPGLANNLCPS